MAKKKVTISEDDPEVLGGDESPMFYVKYKTQLMYAGIIVVILIILAFIYYKYSSSKKEPIKDKKESKKVEEKNDEEKGHDNYQGLIDEINRTQSL